MKRISVFFILSTFFLYASCNLFWNALPPFEVTNVCYVSSPGKPDCSYGCVSFDFYNAYETAVESMEIFFTLYDPVTRLSAFEGVGLIKTEYTGQIKSREKRNLYVSLDKYFISADSTQYIVDLFYIGRVCYLDGKKWKDYSGIYEIREEKSL